ncbi:hypothetical protein LEP1GSC163_1163 [Leptospira santarosai str. CBC379]|nr:hypothetical protein LEP1GSC163_1163 [Leptospira santarosai str. CBC379]
MFLRKNDVLRKFLTPSSRYFRNQVPIPSILRTLRGLQ